MPSAPVRVPRCLSAPTPGWTTTADVIVVGSGIAGLTCALQLRQHVGRVLLVTKTVLNEGSTAWAQGGIAAALDPEDSPEEHLEDTLVAGVGLCDVEAVRVLVTEGPQRVRELVALGAEFDRTDDGEIKLTREGGHHRDRIAHAGGDATGTEISRALIEALRRVVDDPGIEVIEHALVVDLLTDEEDRVAGTTLHVIGEGQIDGVGAAYASAVVLATGGLGQIYTSTTNPPVSTGDGMAAALRAGARITDLEFIQFHPTVLWLGEGSTGQQPLISEAVRGEGAFLVDRDGVRFMQGQHELADLAPRDVVARAILARMRETGTDHVFLDARHLGAEFLEERFPSIVASCRSLGFDPATDLLPVAPAQHYASGGIETDLHGRSSLVGLYACGECSCTGVHGANRLASNSLLEGLVFAHRIAADIPARIASGHLPAAREVVGQRGESHELLDSRHRLDLQRAMTAGSGPVRSADSTAEGLERLAELCALPVLESAGPKSWETTNLLHLGRVLSVLAGRREETRGGHVRSDFPERDDVRWLRHQSLTVTPDRFATISESTPAAPHLTNSEHSVGPSGGLSVGGSDFPVGEFDFPVDEAERVIETALGEDLGADPGRDVTTLATIPAEQLREAVVVARDDGVVAGVPAIARVVDAVSERLGTGCVDVVVEIPDGAAVQRGDVIARLSGATQTILIAERTLLNILSRLSGVATHTRRWADELGGSGAMVLDTRKTTPGLRAVEKYAVRCGGGTNKRMGLYDVAMIKDNHKLAAGGVAAAYDAVRAAYPGVDVQVEVTTSAEALEAIDAGARFIMCDNMSVELLRATVDAIRATGESVEVEATGGLTLEVAAAYAATGVDYLSVGGLTHSSPILDIALDLEE